MDQGNPFISVIIPNYNRGDLLKETLGSLLRQDYSDWEDIVVDDGSDDNSAAIAEEFSQKNPWIRFFRRDRQPSGAPTCRNIGMEKSRGGYLVFLDSDDLLQPFALSQRAEVILREPGYDFWVFPILMFRDDPEKANMLWNTDDGSDDLCRFLMLDAPWQTTGPVWRKEAVEKIGGFTEGLACWQDVDFHLKALISGLKGKKYYHLRPDVLYRRHAEQSVSQGEISSPEKLLSREDIFNRHLDALLPSLTMEQARALALLGGNIAAGAAKSLNRSVTERILRSGSRHGIFTFGQLLNLRLILLLSLLRFNRIPPGQELLNLLTKRYRRDSGIGKHPYRPTPADGNRS
jgi:glycosyltransferase involved in cell wall biosynthesis